MQLKLFYQIKKIYREITKRNQVIMLTSVNIFHNKSSLFPIDLHLNTDSHVHSSIESHNQSFILSRGGVGQ